MLLVERGFWFVAKVYFEPDLAEFEKLGNRNYFLFMATLDDICQQAGFYSKEPHLYVLNKGEVFFSSLFFLFAEIEKYHMMGFLKSFLAEKDNGVIEDCLGEFYKVKEQKKKNENKVFDIEDFKIKDRALCPIFEHK